MKTTITDWRGDSMEVSAEVAMSMEKLCVSIRIIRENMAQYWLDFLNNWATSLQDLTCDECQGSVAVEGAPEMRVRPRLANEAGCAAIEERDGEQFVVAHFFLASIA